MASNDKAKRPAPPAVPLPVDALAALQQLCAQPGQNQSKVAARLGVSDAAVSSALRGKYIGNVDRLAERIRGELLNATVACPVLGEITSRICQDEREKPFHSANPTRVQLWRACKQCPCNPKAEGKP